MSNTDHKPLIVELPCRFFRTIIFALCITAFVALPSDVSAEGRGKQYKIGILAKRGRDRCLEKWSSTAEYLTKRIPGCSFSIVPLGFEQIYPSVERGDVDFVVANSSFYVSLESFYGASRIATLKNLHSSGKVTTLFGGVIFCLAERQDIKKTQDLKNKTFMAVKETSFGGWQTAWRELKGQGIDPHRDFADLQFGGTHDAVVWAVRDGKVDAGTVRTDTLERMAMEGKVNLDDFRIIFGHDRHRYFFNDILFNNTLVKDFPFIHSTRLYPEWPFAKTAKTPDGIAEKVAAALLSMPAGCPAAKAARCAGWTIPMNYRSVRDCLKELRISPYKDYGKITPAGIFAQYAYWIIAITTSVIFVATAIIFSIFLNIKLKASQKVLRFEINERKQAESALLESETRFRVMYESTTEALMLLNVKGFTDCNKSTLEMFGCGSVKEFCGKHPADLSPATQPDGSNSMDLANENIKATMDNGSNHFEWLHKRVDGKEFPADVLLNVLELNGEKVVYALVRDITERKNAEWKIKTVNHQLEQTVHALEAVNAELKDFVYIASHDLREPLRKISSFGELLKDSLTGKLKADDEENFRFMIDGADRMNKMIEGLLVYSRLNRDSESFEAVDLNKIIEQLKQLELNILLAEASPIIEVSDNMPKVFGDHTQIKQVLQNLISNGIKYRAKDVQPRITIIAEQVGEREVKVKVRDNGIGIEEKYYNDIFKMFRRLHSRQKYEGTGIGLAVCKKIIDKHKGQFGVESELGKGTTFWFTLPMAKDVVPSNEMVTIV